MYETNFVTIAACCSLELLNDTQRQNKNGIKTVTYTQTTVSFSAVDLNCILLLCKAHLLSHKQATNLCLSFHGSRPITIHDTSVLSNLTLQDTNYDLGIVILWNTNTLHQDYVTRNNRLFKWWINMQRIIHEFVYTYSYFIEFGFSHAVSHKIQCIGPGVHFFTWPCSVTISEHIPRWDMAYTSF